MAGAKSDASPVRHQGVTPGGRFASLLLTLLPLAVIITSFVLAAVGSSRKDWSWRDGYDPTREDLVYIGTEVRSPFASCTIVPAAQPGSEARGNETSADVTAQTGNWTLSCPHIHAPGGLCNADAQAGVKNDSAFFCQQLGLSAQLLYAGCALVGATLVVLLALTAATAPQVLKSGAYRVWAPRKRSGTHRNHHHHHQHHDGPPFARVGNHSLSAYLSMLATLLAGLGALSLLIGTLVAANSLINIQFPQGDWYTNGVPDPTSFNRYGPWLMGQAVGICAAGAVLAGVGSYCVGLVWEIPRVGVFEAHGA